MKANIMKKVLIALDYNPTAKKVAEDGYAMAKAMNAEILLLHVGLDLGMYSSIYPNMGAWQIDSADVINDYDIANKASHNFLEKVKKHLGDSSVQILQKEGDAAQMILKTAEDIKADCIVMGSHSQKWLENILLGSVTKEVLRKTGIPMFVIPTKKGY